jgi:aminoglycoside 6'-N-acetyltransferase
MGLDAPTAAGAVSFRPLTEMDFPLLASWLAQTHVRVFYQKAPVTLADVALEYGPVVRGGEPALSHLALSGDAPFGYLQCYRNLAYPEWAALIGVDEGVSVDLFIGDPRFLRRGFGRAALREYLRQVAFSRYPDERLACIAHEPANAAALRCSRAVGFRPVRAFIENGAEMTLLVVDRNERGVRAFINE